MIYVKLYSVGKLLNKKRIFNLLSKSILRKNPARNIEFESWIWKKYGLVPEDILTTSLIFLISGLILAVIFYAFSKLGILSMFVFLSAYIGYYILQTGPHNEVKNDKLFFDLFLERLILDYSLILEITDKEDEVFFQIIEEVERILCTKHYNCQKINNLIFNGVTPEKLFMKYLSPSRDLNDFLENLYQYSDKSQLDVGDYSKEMKVSADNYAIETKLSVLFFFSIFYPFGVALLSVVQFIDLPIFIIFLIAFPLLSYKIRTFVLFATLKIFGFEQETPQEMTYFISFLEKISQYLEFYPPEYALLIVIRKSNIPIHLPRNQILSFRTLLSIIERGFKTQKIRYIFSCLEKLILKDSNRARIKILTIKERLKIQRDVQQRRIQLIKAQRIKVGCFIIILPIVLGILCGLFPTFSDLSFFGAVPYDRELMGDLSLLISTPIDFYMYFLGLFLFSSVSAFNFSKIILRKREYIVVLFSSLIFVLSFLVSRLTLSFTLI